MENWESASRNRLEFIFIYSEMDWSLNVTLKMHDNSFIKNEPLLFKQGDQK